MIWNLTLMMSPVVENYFCENYLDLAELHHGKQTIHWSILWPKVSISTPLLHKFLTIFCLSLKFAILNFLIFEVLECYFILITAFFAPDKCFHNSNWKLSHSITIRNLKITHVKRATGACSTDVSVHKWQLADKSTSRQRRRRGMDRFSL